jgi:hypothetical protein
MNARADARLRAQMEYLASDDHIRQRARMLGSMTPAERLELTYELSRAAAAQLDRLPAERRERALAWREPVSPEAATILRRLARGARSDASP